MDVCESEAERQTDRQDNRDGGKEGGQEGGGKRYRGLRRRKRETVKTNSSPSSWEMGGFLPFFISVIDALLERNFVEGRENGENK